VIRLDGVSFAYGRVPVLHDIDLDLGDGDFVGIVGPSGAGKSTLLRLLLGALEPTGGALVRRPGLRVGYVPQVETVSWSFPVTVAEVVLMARPQRRMAPWADATERGAAMDVLERLGIAELADRHIRALSGGQQQRVFLARALLGDPLLLVLDEPTSGVDVRTRHQILHLLGELHDSGLAIVLSTHDLNGIAAHCPTVVCLNGTVTGVGTPKAVLTPEVLEATYGAPMDVLEHAGMPVVVDRPRHHVHEPLGEHR
jgi:ABC-type Mn2+/Zn2+ transport system ATPase subunit